MYYPGASGWIEKYFDLFEKDQIQLVNANDSTLIELSRNSGLLYGVAVETIFISDALQVNWTSKDKLKNLFFEALVWSHWKNSNYN